MNEQRQAALDAALAVQAHLAQHHAQTRMSEELRCRLLPRLLAATESVEERALAREVKRKAVGAPYPGKLHELRGLAAELVEMLEVSDE